MSPRIDAQSVPKKPGKRPTVGFLLASLNTGASRALWLGLLDAAVQHDVNLISFPGGRLNASNAFESQRNLIFDLANPDCLDGLVTWASSLGGVLSPSETNAFHQRYQGLPMVSLAQFMEGLPTVAINSYQGMRELLTHLIQVHGFQRLAFIRGPEEHYYAQERYRAYLDTLQHYNIPLDPQLVTRPLRWESGAEAVQILLDERRLQPGVDFQAVVAVSDLLALWALKTLQSRGYEVPRDVAVTGFNNSIEERLATPPLTTVDLPFYQQGAKSVDMLLEQLNGEPVPVLTTLPSSLVVRQSCGCPSEMVRDAAYVPVKPANGIAPVLPMLNDPIVRADCLAEMSLAAGGSAEDPPGWAEKALDAMLLDMQEVESGEATGQHFLEKLEETLNQAMPGRQNLNLWNGAISVLHRWIVPGISLERRAELEALFAQARVVVSEADQRVRSYWQWQAERQADHLRETNRALLTTFNIRTLGDVLFENLPGLGIPSGYLVLNETAGDPGRHSLLTLAYTEQGRAAMDPAGWRFPTSQLIPPEFLPQDRRYSLVVEPLYFQEKALGYAVFEVGPQNGDIYELVRDNLSSAIQGALLFEEIQQARLTAEKADRIKTRLLANVSHELRTPLNIILSHTQDLLAPAGTDPELRGNIESIQGHAEHQLRVINDLLDLSRAEIDELDLSLELIDPRPLLFEAFQAIAGHHARPEIEWKLNIPSRLPFLRADAVRLRQILLNLLSNARKFTESGRIELGAEVAPPYFHFWVSDTGWGIPVKQQEIIFEPFVTIETNRHISGGIGLGLSITRHLVALHRGRMTLDSETGKGSTFHVYLPLPALEQDRSLVENAQPVLLLISAVGQPSVEILAMCQRQNLQVCFITNQEELESALANTKPMAVAWDIMNSRPGDWNLVRRLRYHPSLSQAPFILYGQLSEGDAEAPTLALGMTGFVAKSPNPQTVLDAMHVFCPADVQGKILIVDDDAEAREAHHQMIEKGLPGCQIISAENGEQAIAWMAGEIPSLVLLDLVMPGISGFDVLDQMRADSRLQQVPVVVLSSKLLSLDDVKRLEKHASVTLQSKGIWSQEEAAAALNRSMFGNDSLPPQTSALVKRAVAYLHQNYSHPLTRWEIAEAVGVSEDYLTRVFNRELEISPWDYLNRYRVLQARVLLRNTSRSIAEIAHLVGFKDQAYFSRVFSRLTGATAVEYRNKSANRQV